MLFVTHPVHFSAGVGPVTKTSDPQEVIRAVNNLRAAGGGDCPELGLTALRLALVNCLPGSVIYFFSDAGFKDKNLFPEVFSLAVEKRVLLIFVLTGKCGSRRRRSTRNGIYEGFNLRRTKRSITDADVFDQLASQTGGQVLQTSKQDIAIVSKIIQLSSSDNSSAADVTILNVRNNLAKQITDRLYTVQADKGLKQIVIKLTATSSPIARVNSSEGNSFSFKYFYKALNPFTRLSGPLAFT